jgi:hypothetical protein
MTNDDKSISIEDKKKMLEHMFPQEDLVESAIRFILEQKIREEEKENTA